MTVKSTVSAFLRSAYRAGTGTSTAADAGIFVDNVLTVALADSANRTVSSASTAHNTVVTDLISHTKPPYYYRVPTL